jgi:uncharacterized protein YgiM (DUF1202 family)
MKKIPYRKIIGVCAALLMVFSMLSQEILDVYAITPTYTVSTDYKNSKYYKNLVNLSLTGNQRSDVVRIALTQLGYHEGNSDADFGGGNTSGSRNFVEYNRLHGKLDNPPENNGYSYGYYWCAAFSTWCAAQAGVPDNIVPTSNYTGVSTQRLRSWFINNAKYYSRGTYTPITGDYIFFKDAGSSVPTTHVGLVLYVKGNTVYTIEGNAGDLDCVALKEYSLNNTYIAGYGVPNYKSGTAISLDLTNRANPGDYVTTPSSLAIRTGTDASYSVVGSLPQTTVVTVTEIRNNWGKVSYNGMTGWISLAYAMPLSIPDLMITYDANGGTGAPASQVKTSGMPILLSITVPKRAGYRFLGWSTSPTATKALYASGGSYTADQSVKLYAVWEKESYIIQFADYDGRILQSQTYSYGDTVTAPASPTRPADQTYKYTFSGWDKTVSKATGNMIYTAVYKKEYIEYTVLFCDADGTVLSRQLYHYNDTVTNMPVPQKAADKTYSYTFVGWGEPVAPVTEDKVYTAVYDKTYLEYLVTFSDENGIILSQKMYHYGDTVLQPKAPTKASDQHYDYIFLGWDKEVGKVEGMVFYTATYAKEPRQYTVTFRDTNGDLIATSSHAYGETVTPPASPTKETDEKYSYTFLGWSADGENPTAILPVTTDTEYVAVYLTDPVIYTITFRDDAGNIYATKTYHYGDAIEIPQDPVKPATSTHTYRFVGWSEPVSETVEKDMTYVAQFTPVPIEEGKKPGVDNLLSPGQSEKSIPVLGISIVAITAVAVVGCVIWMLNKKRG